MMDIVERLRERAQVEKRYDERGARYIGLGTTLEAGAADEIERLRRSRADASERKLEEEVKKLRGLLRDSLVGTDPRWMVTDAGREWLLRVREALGDD